MNSIIPRINKEFLEVALEEGIRLDNRLFESFRHISIKKLDKNGHVQVQIGNTICVCYINSSLISPQCDKPNEGQIVFNVDTSHLKHEAECLAKSDDLGEFRTKLNNLLEKSLKDTRAFDTNSLCVINKTLVWKLVVNIIPIVDNGNIYDCCYLSVLASWMSIKIPFLKKDSITNSINYDIQQTKYINLPVLHLPICVTTCIINNKFLIDPSIEEEKVCNGIILTVANKFDEICYFHTFKSCEIEPPEVTDILMIVKPYVELISCKLKEFQKSVNSNISTNYDNIIININNNSDSFIKNNNKCILKNNIEIDCDYILQTHEENKDIFKKNMLYDELNSNNVNMLEIN